MSCNFEAATCNTTFEVQVVVILRLFGIYPEDVLSFERVFGHAM